MCGVPGGRLQRISGLVLLLATLAVACSTTDAAPPSVPAAAEAVPCEAVPVVALLLDKSRSAPASLVSQLAVRDLDPLIELLRDCGGELAVGAIRDRAATPMVRLFIDAPPRPPVPDTVPQVGNPMILAEQRARAEQAHKQQRAAYEPGSRRWTTTTEAAIEEFRRDVRAVIAEPTTSPSTNIWAALRQADLFLSEPRAGRNEGAGTRASPAIPARLVLVALTDGVHTAPDEAYRLQSSPQLFIVNSTGQAGVFAGMNPARFESVPAMLRAIGSARSARFSGQD
jgi:hypothetical protein